MGKFITTLIVIDTFLVSYAVGFNSRHVLVIDPSLPALKPPAADAAKPAATPVKAETQPAPTKAVPAKLAPKAVPKTAKAKSPEKTKNKSSTKKPVAAKKPE